MPAVNDPKRVFNFDETNLSFCPRMPNVLVQTGYKSAKFAYTKTTGHTEKGSVTALVMTNALGDFPPPMIILQGEKVNLDKFDVYDDQTGEPLNYALACSENGWITFKTLFEYLINIFDAWLIENNIQKPVIVYCDWHETRSNIYLARILNEKQIILITFVPNTTHFSQPLDV